MHTAWHVYIGDNVKNRDLNINCNSVFGLAWQKIVRNHLTRLDFLTQTKKEIHIAFSIMADIYQWVKIYGCPEKTFNKILPRPETFRDQVHNTW